MAYVKREVEFGELELCVDVPEQVCRQILSDGDFFDPGIGVMIILQDHIAFFRVR